MGAENEGPLQEHLIDRALDRARALGVLVLHAEPEELRRLELQIRRDRPLSPRRGGQLCPVPAYPGRPMPVEIVLPVEIGPPAIEVSGPARPRVRGAHVAKAGQGFAGEREHREAAAACRPLVLGPAAHARGALVVGGEPAGPRDVDLQPAEVVELEERAPAARDEGLAQRAAAASGPAVARYDSARQ